MSAVLDKILAWAERQLPDERQIWISDLRAEAKYIPSGFTRMGFQWSGIIAAAGYLLRVQYGPQKIGQLLLATALIILSLAVLASAGAVEDKFVQTVFYLIGPFYALAAAFAATNLRLMKRYTGFFGIIFAVMFVASGLETVSAIDVPIMFLRALTLEGACLMAGLFIAASYLGWVGEGEAQA